MQNNQLVIYTPDTPDTNNTKIGKNYKLGNLSITGNVMPISWYHTITLANTKPDQVGSAILSELLNQHDITGKSRFAMTYKYFKKKFNFTKIQVRAAIIRLEEKILIKREFKTIQGQRRKIPNQMFLCLNLEQLQKFCK